MAQKIQRLIGTLVERHVAITSTLPVFESFSGARVPKLDDRVWKNTSHTGLFPRLGVGGGRSGVLLTGQNLKTLTVRYDIDELRHLERGEHETAILPRAAGRFRRYAVEKFRVWFSN